MQKIKLRLTKKRKIFLVAVVIVILVGVFLIVKNNIDNKDDISIPKDEKTQLNIQKLLDNGDFNSAKNDYESLYKNSSDQLKKGEFAYQIAHVYMSLRDFDNAKKWFQQSVDDYSKVQNNQEAKTGIETAKSGLEKVEYTKSVQQYKEDLNKDDGAL